MPACLSQLWRKNTEERRDSPTGPTASAFRLMSLGPPSGEYWRLSPRLCCSPLPEANVGFPTAPLGHGRGTPSPLVLS